MIKLWNFFTLELLSNLENHLLSVTTVIFRLNRLYSSGNDGKIYYYNLNISESQNIIKTKSYYHSSLALSIELELIAFGLKTLNFYCLKNNIETGSIILEGLIISLDFIKFITACGTNTGQLFFVDSQSLNIIKQFALSKAPISFFLGSKNCEKLLYSSNNKSKIIDFNLSIVIFNYRSSIRVATFSEKDNLLVFLDNNFNLFILKDYRTLIEIFSDIISFQLYLSSNRLKLAIKYNDSNFWMISINRVKLISKANKLRKLEAGITYSKKAVLVSCLTFNSFIR